MNDFSEVLRIINEIDSAVGNEKHPLIVDYINSNPLFAKVVQYTYDTSKTYKIKSVKKSSLPENGSELFDALDFMDNKKSATKGDRITLSAIASESDDKFEVVNRILSRSLKCGFTGKTLDNLVPGFVPYFPYMRCSGIESIHKLVFPCFSQIKADGEYFDIFLDKSSPVFRTRNGKIADFSLVPTKKYNLDIPTGKLSGEALLMTPDGAGYEKRKDGNAIINKALYGNLSEDEANRIRFSIWDFTFDGCENLYFERWQDLQELGLPLIECKIVHSIEEAYDHYYNARLRGLEGTVLKNFKGKHIDGVSPDQFKLKAVKECELEVIDTIPGQGKYKGMIGSLVCKSSCGELITNVGMGLSDRDRVRGDWVGLIITVCFNEVSKSKDKDTWALVHARLVDDRPDKLHADDLEYIMKIKEVKKK